MDLWIRSQDRKRLIKCEKLITVEFADKTECEIWDNTVKLGAYKNIERALEVLDEIQNCMLKGSFAKKLNGLGEEIDLIPNPIFVYQMLID